MAQITGTFTSLEAALLNPQAVTVLDLSNQGLEKLPEGIFELPNLDSLDLRHNRLDWLPVEMANLPIRHLQLSHNQFSKFPAILCNLRKIEEIDIAYNNIREVPNELNYLTDKLKYLNFKDNLLEQDQELRAIRSLPKTDIDFSLVKSYDPSRPKDHNWTHIDDKRPFNWLRFLSWMAVPATLIGMTLLLRLAYQKVAPDPYPQEPRIETPNPFLPENQ